MRDSYRTLLGHPGARRLLGAVAGGWLSFGMVGLAIFLTVARASRSAGVAGFAVGAFSLGSAGLAPLRGRLIDRGGMRPWLPLLAGGYAVALLLLAFLGLREPPVWVSIVCPAAAGVSAPPLIASVRALWAGTIDHALLRRAYALTSLLGDAGLVSGPALAGALFVMAPWSPLVICGLAALGAAVVAAGAPSTAAPTVAEKKQAAPLIVGPLRMLLAVSVALGAAFGLIEVAVPAAATRWHATAYSGLLLAAFAMGSIIGGLWFGHRCWRQSPEQRYLIALLLLATALVPLLAATDAATLAPLLIIAGLPYGPATISLFEALDLLPPARRTEAFTWFTTAEAIGVAIGASASGWASTNLGTEIPFALASLTLALATAAGLLLRRARL